MSSAIETTYRERTPTSAKLMERAARSLPGGSTRTLGWHLPYPLVFDHGDGSVLWDTDGNEYIDFVYNGLSLIHGHSYPPVIEALAEQMPKGTAWPSASVPQIDFAELLCQRVPNADLVRFANTGTEAAMLAIKVARHYTGRHQVLKAWGGYHGSYADLEAGLAGQGPLPGRVVLGDFGNVTSFADVIRRNGAELAAVILEPVMYTGVVTPPPPGFLAAVEAACREVGALFIVDDCLMFRLGEGGSQERFGLDPDLTVLGKFIGGGLPVGAVAGRGAVMGVLDPRGDAPIYHGGSFNGNPLGMVAGRRAIEDLTTKRIDQMEELTGRLREEITARARARGVPLSTAGYGSVFGIYLSEEPPTPASGRPAEAPWLQFHLALLNHGVYVGTEGEMALATSVTEEIVETAIDRFDAALADFATTITDADV